MPLDEKNQQLGEEMETSQMQIITCASCYTITIYNYPEYGSGEKMRSF